MQRGELSPRGAKATAACEGLLLERPRFLDGAPSGANPGGLVKLGHLRRCLHGADEQRPEPHLGGGRTRPKVKAAKKRRLVLLDENTSEVVARYSAGILSANRDGFVSFPASADLGGLPVTLFAYKPGDFRYANLKNARIFRATYVPS